MRQKKSIINFDIKFGEISILAIFIQTVYLWRTKRGGGGGGGGGKRNKKKEKRKKKSEKGRENEKKMKT